MRRIMLMGLGWLFVGLGTLGALLPLLPTTPFILVAALCFTHSSPRLKAWLKGHKLFKPIFNTFGSGQRLSRRHRFGIFLLGKSMMLFGIFAAKDNPHLQFWFGVAIVLEAFVLAFWNRFPVWKKRWQRRRSVSIQS